METLTRRQQWLDNEDFVFFTQESWESILSLPDAQRYENMTGYVAISSFLLTDRAKNVDNEKLWQFMKDHGAGYIVDGFFVPRELESLESLLESKFGMVGWSDGGIYFKVDAKPPVKGHEENIVFNTWAEFHQYVTDCFAEDSDDVAEVMDCRFICEKIRHFLSLNPSLPQIKEEAAEKAA